MTRKVSEINKVLNEELLEINPGDAAAIGVSDGDMVSITSRRGKIKVKAKISEVTPIGVVSMDFHFAESPANILTNPAFDPVSKIPELKIAAVRVEKNGH
jgi:predicted molibdopterin-dependent oxidoreductase YjgC